MIKRITLYYVLAAVIMATGCPKNLPKADFSTDVNSRNYVVNQLKQNVYYNEWIKFDCSRRGYKYNVTYRVVPNGERQDKGTGESATCSTEKNPNGLAEAAYIRNSVLNNGRGLIDQVFVKYASAIAERRSTVNFLADLAELGAGAAAGTVKGPARALNLIGVFLTAFRGGRQSAEINFYNEIPTATLINEMNAARETVLGDILAKKNLDANEYDFDAALSDLVLYLYEGSLLSASTRLNRDSAVKAQVAEAKRKALEKIPITPIVSVEVAKVNKQIGQDLEDLENDCDSIDPAIKDRANKRYNLIVLNIVNNQEFAAIIADMKGTPDYKKIIDFFAPTTMTPTTTPNPMSTVTPTPTSSVAATEITPTPTLTVTPTPTPTATSSPTPTPKTCDDLITFIDEFFRRVTTIEQRNTFKEIINTSRTTK